MNGQSSEWAIIKSGVSQGSVLGPLLFLIFINDLEANLTCQVKFFADDTFLFTIVKNPETAALNLNKDLDSIAKWAYQWKMSFNPDPTKPAQEILFSCKKSSPLHPPLYFKNSIVKRVESHKHLGLLLDSKLNFSKHIAEKIKVSRKWIGIIKQSRRYLPLKSLDQIYKMQIRPHLDYCDIIYHKPANTNNPEHYLSLNYLMNSLEKIQYEAALAITGAWKGSNTDKLYEELGWESLHHRRIFRRLTMFYKIHNNLTPIFLKHPLQMSQQSYALRGTCNLPSISARTDRYRHSFYPDAVDLWNKLDASIKNSLLVFLYLRLLF